jgi:hypothetical protein
VSDIALGRLTVTTMTTCQTMSQTMHQTMTQTMHQTMQKRMKLTIQTGEMCTKDEQKRLARRASHIRPVILAIPACKLMFK